MGSNQELTNILAELVKTNAMNRQPNFQQVTGLSQAILSGVGLQKPYETEQQNTPDIRGPSFVNRVLDILSRPMYAAENMLKGNLERNQVNIDNPDPTGAARDSFLEALNPLATLERLKDIWAGLSGKEKTTGKDILDTTGFSEVMPGPAKAAVGFGLDIAADPLTYAGGVGLLPKVGKAARTSTEALATIEKGTSETAQTLSEEISRRAAQQAQKANVEIPTRGLPAPEIGAPPRTFAAGPAPEIIEQFPLPAPKPRVPIAELTATPAETPLGALLKRKPGSANVIKDTAKVSVAFPTEEVPAILNKIRTLHKSISSTSSPIAKNVFRKEIEKLQAGVKPADILSQARVSPPPFPELTINQRWIDSARAAAQSFLKTNRMKNINEVGQTNLYNRVLNAASKVRKDRRQFHVLQMLRVAEEEILKSGRHLVDAEGISVRLSDIANMSGGARTLTPRLVDDFRKARPSQQIENLKAFTTPQVASEILDPVINTGAKVADAVKDLPPSQTVMIGSQLSKELVKLAESAGASSREAKTAKAFIDDLFNPVR
ncbi:MAG: hypothetical protein HMLIMOIP_002108, partial [Candidatus Nitrosomirales archaeon]